MPSSDTLLTQAHIQIEDSDPECWKAKVPASKILRTRQNQQQLVQRECLGAEEDPSADGARADVPRTRQAAVVNRLTGIAEQDSVRIRRATNRLLTRVAAIPTADGTPSALFYLLAATSPCAIMLHHCTVSASLALSTSPHGTAAKSPPPQKVPTHTCLTHEYYMATGAEIRRRCRWDECVTAQLIAVFWR